MKGSARARQRESRVAFRRPRRATRFKLEGPLFNRRATAFSYWRLPGKWGRCAEIFKSKIAKLLQPNIFSARVRAKNLISEEKLDSLKYS